MKTEHCCEEFAKYAGEYDASGSWYPQAAQPPAQFEADTTRKTWNINGCCGGGCYVVNDMKYCPFCGSKLFPETSDENDTA